MIAQLEHELKKYPYEYKVKMDDSRKCFGFLFPAPLPQILASVSPPNQTFISHEK